MASRVLTRSKALAHALSRADAAAPSPLYGARSLRALSTLPQDPAAAAAADPSQRQTLVCSPLDAPKGDGIRTLTCVFNGAASHGRAGGGIGTLSNLFHGASVRPGMVVPSNREIHSGSAARCSGRSRNGMPSSITNRKDLLHEQNMKIIKLQNEFEITKAEMEVLRAEIKLEVTKGQTTMLKYCIFVVGAGLVGSWLVESFAS